jgi:hypothetical protein
VNLVPYGVAAAAATVVLGRFLSGGWLVVGTLATLAGASILVSFFASALGSLFAEAGRRLRGLIEESPALAALDSLAALFLSALALVLAAGAIPGLHYALGLQRLAAALG